MEGVDFKGVDIQYKMVDSAEACQKACDEDDKCQFYTYVTAQFVNLDYRYCIFCVASLLKQTKKILKLFLNVCCRRRCYLKRTITTPAPPKIVKLQNVVSGFSLTAVP